MSDDLPLRPEQRQALQQRYDQASQLMQQPSWDFDQVHNLLAECVKGDPGNVVYTQAMLKNLEEKSKGPQPPKRFLPGGIRTRLLKAAENQDWGEVLQSGPEVLAKDPRDIEVLSALARACEANEYPLVAVMYFEAGIAHDGKNVELHRQVAHELARLGCFDQAISHWLTIESLDPRDEEAPRMISTLTLEKARQPIDTDAADAEAQMQAESAGEAASQTPAASESPVRKKAEPEKPKKLVLTTRQQLELRIRENPEDETSYLELAELHLAENRLFDAQRTLIRAQHVSSDLQILERLEDVNILRAKEQVEIARQRAAEEPNAEAVALVEKLKEEHQLLELEIFRARSERYPDNKSLQFELGMRLKILGSLRLALEPLQAGLDVPQHRAEASFQIGEILQSYKQFPKALQCYRQSAQLATLPQDEQVYHRALYRAGSLATSMGLHDSAKQYLLELVKSAPNYKDTRSRLDKLVEIDEDL